MPFPGRPRARGTKDLRLGAGDAPPQQPPFAEPCLDDVVAARRMRQGERYEGQAVPRRAFAPLLCVASPHRRIIATLAARL